MLPEWAERWLEANLGNIGGGLLILFASMLSFLGFRAGGRAAKAPEPAPAEIAGAIIDNAKANALIAAFDRNTKAHEENTAASRDTAAGIRAIISEVGKVVDAADETNDRLERIKDELIRMNAPRGR